MTNSLYQFPDDIRSEFSIDVNGQVWASATARLAGVSVSALVDSRHGLLARLKSAEDKVIADKLPDCLKPFAGFDYKVIAKIPDTLVYATIAYYAFESTGNDNTQARKVALAIGSIGVRAWVKQELRLQQSLPSTNTQQILAALNEQNNRLNKVEKAIIARLAAERHHPGIGEIVDGLSTTRLLPPADLSEPFTAREYVRVIHGIELTKGEAKSLGKFASDAFTAINKETPEKRTYGKSYYHRDLQAWEVIFDSWIGFHFHQRG